MKATPAPLASIIIIAWNNKEHLAVCLGRLLRQIKSDIEIILVDNGSTDGLDLDHIPSSPDVSLRIERLSSNLGFAVANNIGARLARGEWLVLLNADAYPEPDWLENLLRAAEQNPEYNFFSSRQIQYHNPHLLDGAGDEYHVSGLAWRRFYNYTADQYGLAPQEVFGACAAAAMYRREDFLKAGGFDEDYFSYFEDVDLSFRLRLAGGRCLYVPDAVVRHVGSASAGKLSDFVIYHGHRNLVWTFIKNMPGPLVWIYLPLHLLMNLFFMISFTFRGKGSAILRAKRDALLKIADVLRKRKSTQSLRTTSARSLHQWMKTGLLDPYWASRQRKREGRHDR
ncbi:glycosyltransferase family 2 protein [Chloroflexi bacterium CFX5]|nr:glycosyltransferase family 2 protein [Chloroflexi bacterium CFX5]